MTDLDSMNSFIRFQEVASCYQTQQTSDPSMNLYPGTSQGSGATFEGGTKRSGRKPACQLVPIEVMKAVARTREEGDRKYEPSNWMKGSKEFFVDCLGHAIEHLQLCVWDEEEDIWIHLGHAATNIAFILWALARRKVTRRDFQRAAVLAQDEKMEILKARQAKIQAETVQAPPMLAQLQSQVSTPSTKSSSEPLRNTTGCSYGSSMSR